MTLIFAWFFLKPGILFNTQQAQNDPRLQTEGEKNNEEDEGLELSNWNFY